MAAIDISDRANKVLESLSKELENATSILHDYTGIDSKFGISSAEIKVVTTNTLKDHLKHVGAKEDHMVVLINQPFSAISYLSFVPEEANKIVAAAIGSNLSEQIANERDDILLEIANVLLNMCLIDLAKNLSQPIEGDLPKMLGSHALRDILEQRLSNKTLYSISIQFTNSEINIEGRATLTFPKDLI